MARSLQRIDATAGTGQDEKYMHSSAAMGIRSGRA